MRHATAGHQGAQRDLDRPLTTEGTRDAAAAGEWIRQHLPPVDAVLCSTAVRTQQTLVATGLRAPTTLADELYGGGVEEIVEQIGATPESARTLLVVGHAPGIPATAAELATVAALVRADGNPDAADPNLDELRSFSACALAVLTTEAAWPQLAELGGDLLTVRHPGR